MIGHTEAGEREAAQRVARGDVCWIDVNEVTVDDTMRYYSVNEVTWGLGGAAAAAQYARCLGPARYDICAGKEVAHGSVVPLRGQLVGSPGALAFRDALKQCGVFSRAPRTHSGL